MNKEKNIRQCLAQIESKLNWGPSESWHSEVFDELSNHIQEKTGVLLSSSTLKRVWGKVNHDGAPSTSTLNALAQFIDHENWRDFVAKNQTRVFLSKKWTARIAATIGALLLLVAVSQISFPSVEAVSIQMDVAPVTSGLPNSVIFNFDPIPVDSGRIQLFWDPTKTIKLHKDQKTATGIYYYPGYFAAQLIADGQTLATHDVFIESNGWMATVDHLPVPTYVQLDASPLLRLPAVIEEEIRNEENPVTSTYHWVKDVSDFDGDNFELTAVLKHGWQEKWGICQKSQIVLLGTSGAMVIPFSAKGCVSDLGVMINDKYISGRENDLSSLGVDLSTDTSVRILNKEKQLSVFLGEIEVFQAFYEAPMGRLIGLRFRFEGYGEVREVDLNNQLLVQDILLTKD